MKTNIYKAKIIYIVEGNLYDMVLDLGFFLHYRTRIRLDGLELPSLRSSSDRDRAFAKKAKDCAMHFLLQREVLAETFKESSEVCPWYANIFVPDIQTAEERAYTRIEAENYLDVCRFMRCLADKNYDIKNIDIPPATKRS